MSVNEKCRMYKETQSSIRKQLEKGVKFDKNIYLSQIVLIKKDVTSNDESIKKTALEMLNFLLHLNIEEIEVELVKMLHDNTVPKILKTVVLKSIKEKVVNTISGNMSNFTNLLSPWKNQNVNQLTNIIEDVCVNDLPKDKCKHFFIDVIVSTMMSTNTNNQIRDALIDIAFMMSTIFTISDLTSEELESFLKDVNTKYILNIGDLRDKDYPNWHNLWIFLVRFCDKHIHCSMDLTNRLLRVVEFAFRNSSFQQRLRGYDCWKELIDNASLDMNHMCSARQIKLLITPLKAKFSKQEVVICKRFDVFTYLLEKLQHKAVLCLTEFLEFCFGPVGENKDASKTGQGKSVPQLWNKSTKVLIEIIGHSHDKTVSCLSTEDVIKLEKPVINYLNISNYHKIIIKSVGECCSLLKEVDIESKRETVLKCMWKSIFNLVIPSNENNRSKYFQLISEIMDNYFAQSRENPYFEFLLAIIFSVLMSYDEEFVYEVIQYILKQLFMILFTIDDIPSSAVDKFKAVLSLWFSKILLIETKLKVLKETLTLFVKLKPSEENVNKAGKIWLCLANELVVEFSREQIEKFDGFNDFFTWPAYSLHHLDEVTKKQTVLHWMKLYRKLTIDMELKKLNVMKELQKIFKVNPLLNPNVVSLLNVMSQFETKFMKEFVTKIMMVSSQILQLPNLRTEEEQKITALVMQYFEPSLECFKGDACDEVIKNICICIEHILCMHKGFKLLDTLVIFMRNSPPNLRLKFSKQLSPLLLDLFAKETDSSSFNAKELQKALHILSVENAKKDDLASVFFPPGGRSARIASMAKNSPRSPKKKGKNAELSPTALRLFGKDLNTLSPLHVKGSQLNNTTPKSRKTGNTYKAALKNSPSINDEKSSDFVPIDTKVKFQPEKLSKHQKEVLRKRREDIPALYQDLSQSLSQDMFSSSSSSKGFEKTDKDKFDDNRKVIVEVIREQFETPTQKEVFEAPKTIPDVLFQVTSDVAVPNLFNDLALSSEIIPEAPLQNIEDLNIPNTDLNFEANLFPEALLPTDITPDEVIQAIKEVVLPSDGTNPEENVFPQTVEGQKVLDPEETMIEEDKRVIEEIKSEDIGNVDCNEALANQELEEAAKKDPYQVEDVVEEKESGVKSEAEEKERRRKQKIELELQKLRMDIVGAEEFIAASRRTRTREKPKKLEDIPNKKPKTISNDEKLSPQRQQMLRRSLSTDNSESKDIVTEKNRRKTIGVIQETKSDIGDSSKVVEDKFNKPKDPDTPKRGRKPKAKLDQAEKTPTNKMKPKKGLFDKGEVIETSQAEKGEKRKRSNGDEDSEDIIESSQQFHSELTPVFNSSKRKSLIEASNAEQLDKSEEKTMVQQKTVTKDDFLPEELHDMLKVNVADVAMSEIKTTPIEEVAVDPGVQKAREAIHVDVDSKQIENIPEDAEEIQPDVNTTQDTTVTHESTADMTQIEEVEAQNAEQNTSPQDTQTQDAGTQDTLTQSEYSTVSEDMRPPVLYFDLPKKPELTESERMMCQMDTMSICINPIILPLESHSGDQLQEVEIESKSSKDVITDHKLSMEMDDILDTPASKASSDLPSSPITVETPNRTSELLNNTLDISPINSKSSSDDGESEENSVPISINFKAEMEELDKIEKEDILEMILEKKSQEREIEKLDTPQGSIDLDDNGQIPVLFGDILTHLDDIPQQDAEVPISHQPEENLQHDDVTSFGDFQYQEENVMNEIEETPAPSDEVRNPSEDIACHEEQVSLKKPDMPDLGSVKTVKEGNIQERASRLLNMVNVSSPMTHKMYIKKRSATMSPSTARIKRLMSSFNQRPSSDEVVTDVREEDLLTFTRDIPSPLAVPRSSILKRKVSDSSDSEGISPCPKRKRVNFSDPCLTSKKLFIKDDYNRDLDTNPIFDEPPESTTDDDAVPTTTFEEPPSSERLTETENVETEPSLEMVNALMLKKDRPIYPKLVDCKEDVLLILKKVTSPMFITTLVDKLKNKEIKTIGDLAKQSEAEINRFPFKVPVVLNVYKALDNYYKKNVLKDGLESVDRPKVNGLEESKRQGVIRKTSPKRVDYKMELRQLVERSKSKGTMEEVLKIVLCSVEKEQLLTVAKAHYNLETKDFLKETDFKFIIKHIAQQTGLPNVLEMLTTNFENSEDESVYYDCILKQSLEKRSLSNLWESRSLDDIRNGLEESINRNVFSRREVVDRCLLPLIENPSDISGYVSRISVVQLGDIVVQKLESTDLTEFFSRILNAYNGEWNVTLSKEVLVRVESSSDVVGVFKDCVGARNEEQRNEIMVEMFKFISGELSVNTLLELHVDFLKRISGSTLSSEK